MTKLKEEMFLRYLKGMPSGDDVEEIGEWLKMSEQNQDILFGMEMVYDLPYKKRLEDPEQIAKVEKRMISRIAAHEKVMSGIRNKRRSAKTIWKYAAAAAAVIMVVAGVMLFRGHAFENDITISVAAGEPVKHIVLPDGTDVWLNQSSTLRYAESFSVSNRSVHLDGEAYFDVAKNPSSPFVAGSEALQVTVLGTAFNMKSFSKCHTAEATLISGEIKISGNNDEGQVVLLPGQKAEVNTATGRMTVKSVNAPLDAVWRDNLIPFNESSIEEIARTLEHFYDVKIVLMKGVNTVNRYSGVIRRKDNINEVLSLLTHSIPVTYQISGKTIYIGPAKK